MDTLCGIGLPELVILALLGFVVIGPERSKEVALKAGRFLRGMMRSPWWKEFNDITSAIRNLPTTLVRMAELEEIQAELQQTVDGIHQETSGFMRGRPERPDKNFWGIDPEPQATTGEEPSTPEKGPSDSLPLTDSINHL